MEQKAWTSFDGKVVRAGQRWTRPGESIEILDIDLINAIAKTNRGYVTMGTLMADWLLE